MHQNQGNTFARGVIQNFICAFNVLIENTIQALCSLEMNAGVVADYSVSMRKRNTNDRHLHFRDCKQYVPNFEHKDINIVKLFLTE